MAQIVIENPELYDSKDVDSSGRIYIGKEWANKKARIVIEAVEEDLEEDKCSSS